MHKTNYSRSKFVKLCCFAAASHHKVINQFCLGVRVIAILLAFFRPVFPFLCPFRIAHIVLLPQNRLIPAPVRPVWIDLSFSDMKVSSQSTKGRRLLWEHRQWKDIWIVKFSWHTHTHKMCITKYGMVYGIVYQTIIKCLQSRTLLADGMWIYAKTRKTGSKRGHYDGSSARI